MKYIILIVVLCTVYLSGNSQENIPFEGKQIQLKAADGVPITADLYTIADKKAPLIILFHQAGFSRGAYRAIAPKLNKLGFHCLAIDQRSGNAANGVVNETHQQAVAMKKETSYTDALPDLIAALDYAKKELSDNIILWGSSYSASLVFYLGAKHPESVKGILSFSPRDQFMINGEAAQSYASAITCPVFVTSAKKEYANWQGIYGDITTEKYYYKPETAGTHGARALWTANEGHEGYWQAVEKFLMKLQ